MLAMQLTLNEMISNLSRLRDERKLAHNIQWKRGTHTTARALANLPSLDTISGLSEGDRRVLAGLFERIKGGL